MNLRQIVAALLLSCLATVTGFVGVTPATRPFPTHRDHHGCRRVGVLSSVPVPAVQEKDDEAVAKTEIEVIPKDTAYNNMCTTRTAARIGLVSFLVACTVTGATWMAIPPDPALALTKQDLQEIQEIVMASEKRMETKFDALENKMDAKFDAMENKMDALENKFFWVPIITAGISVAASIYNADKLDRAIGQFKGETDKIKADLAAGTKEIAFREGLRGNMLGVVFALIVVAAVAAIQRAEI